MKGLNFLSYIFTWNFNFVEFLSKGIKKTIGITVLIAKMEKNRQLKEKFFFLPCHMSSRILVQ